MTKTLATLWDASLEERSISLCPTSLTSDYRQVGIIEASLEAQIQQKLNPTSAAGVPW